MNKPTFKKLNGKLNLQKARKNKFIKSVNSLLHQFMQAS